MDTAGQYHSGCQHLITHRLVHRVGFAGKYLLVNRVKRPYSYAVSYYSFPRSVEVWDTQGTLVSMIADLPLADQVPLHDVVVADVDVDIDEAPVQLRPMTADLHLAAVSRR